MGIFGKLFKKKETAQETFKKEEMLRCKVCGHTQGKGDWEKAMDAQAKRMGMRGFVNMVRSLNVLSVDPEN